MVVFPKIWGKIHGFDQLSKKEQDAMSARMGPYYAAQVVVTIGAAWALIYFINALPNVSPYFIAFMAWVGFLLPANVSSVIFGGTETKYILPKSAILVGGALVATLAGAFVASLF